jgi:hypothetical protein
MIGPKSHVDSFDAHQTGHRGAIKGKFYLSVYKEKPLFSGSITVGTLGK